MTFVPTKDKIDIREVWSGNLDNEMALIRDIVLEFPFISMDTEYPGVVFEPHRSDYPNIRNNVNHLKLIQLGLTFFNEKGFPPNCGTDKHILWQFNFREFNLDTDMGATNSLSLLMNSGINFRKNHEEGVEGRRFAELLQSSGAVLTDDSTWVTFHSAYDFAYLLKLMIGKDLPQTRDDFMILVNAFFPNVYDVKHLMRYCNGLNHFWGLNRLARELGVERVGTSHQAGSDSLLTCSTYVKMKELFFDGAAPVAHAGTLHGLD